MFKPSEEKSDQTHQLINGIFSQKIGPQHSYTVAYAYYMQSGLFANKMFSYVVGFSALDKALVIIPLDSKGNSGEAVVLKKEAVLSVKRGMQGDVRIKTRQGKSEYRLIVPGYTPTSLANAYILPIVQEEQAIKFLAFIKETF